MIRGKVKGCPFALPIKLGCENVGKQIESMRPIVDPKTGEANYSNAEFNFKKFFYVMTGDDKNKRRCPFAKTIDGNKNQVICTYGEVENSDGEVTQLSIDGSPTQINVFDTNPTNNGLPLYGDSSFEDDNIRDIPIGLANVGRQTPDLT